MCSSSTVQQPPAADRQSPLGQAVRVNRLMFAPRRRKEVFLPKISELALEGYGCREIGRRLGLGKSTVNRWLQELLGDYQAKLADTTGMTALTFARYESLYREAMEAWRRSQADKEVRLVEDSEGAGGPKSKRSVRRETRAGDAAFLGKAQKAAGAICKLVVRDAPRQNKVVAADRGPIRLDASKEDDLRHVNDDELREIAAQGAAETKPLENAA